MKTKKIKKSDYLIPCVELSTTSRTQVNWGAEKVGFGSFHISKCSKSGKALIDSEFMSRDFIKAVLCRLVDEAVFTDFEELTEKETDLTLTELNSHNICGALAENENEFNTINYPELAFDSTGLAVLIDKNPMESHTIKVWLTPELSRKIANDDNEYLALVESVCEQGFVATDVLNAVKLSYEKGNK